MCCFSAKTEVHGTSIFARLTKPGVQALAYQMTYKAAEPTAMILPLPVALPAREGSVRFVDLKAYPDFFSSLDAGFPHVERSAFFGSKSAAAVPPSQLAVHDVGDFIASFVPTVADFDRVDARFAISKDVWAKIPAYKDYGFAVFQLKQLSGAPHPIAFELDTRLTETVFFPTVHIHDGTVHETDDFDHALYLQAAAFDDRVGGYDGPDAIDKRTGFVRSKLPAREFADAARAKGLVDPALLVHKVTMNGKLPNKDTFYDLKAIASASRGCSRCDAAGGGGVGGAALHVGLAAAGFAWIVRRRDALRGKG
ncbi:MAG: hypothetical protein KC657_19670 [Myxococcales bacterium]|nr:hypothetical protein [Myxococcales bacterium]